MRRTNTAASRYDKARPIHRQRRGIRPIPLVSTRAVDGTLARKREFFEALPARPWLALRAGNPQQERAGLRYPAPI